MKRYIWGFPGVGKSGLNVPGLSIVDADCNLFIFNNVFLSDLHVEAGHKQFERNYNYPNNYLEHIRNVDADIILLNCHISLLEQLGKENVLVVYPDVSLMPEYLERYRSRGDNESFISYMEEEAEGMIRFIDGSDFGKYRIDSENTYLRDLFEREDFKMKLMTRKELTEQLQRAIDLNVVIATYQAGDNARLVCDAKYSEMDIKDIQSSVNYSVERVHNAAELAEKVLDGKFQLDIDALEFACNKRESEIEKELVLMERRGGLSHNELAGKIMQGIVNGALGIRYSEIAPYSHGYEVTFGGKGPAGSTLDFKNRWECYCDLFDVPEKIAVMIENGRQSSRVFGAQAQALNVREMVAAIDEMEGKQITSFVPEKEAGLERRGRYSGHVASVMDVHAGKALDGIVQHHFHGDYSSCTPVKQNNLVETLVCMKGFCLDCIGNLDIGPEGRKKVVEFLKKKGIDVSTPEKMRTWILENSEKCALLDNRSLAQRVTEEMERERAFEEGMLNRFGLSQEIYDDFRRKGLDNADIWLTVNAWGVDAVERGYDIFTCSGSDVIVEGALVVEMISELDRFESDFEACRQAEKDGVKFINDVDGLEKGCYVDTPENRALCVEMLKENPGYRVENWLDVNSDFGRKYVEHFGDPIAKTNEGLDKKILDAEGKKKEPGKGMGEREIFLRD